MASVQIFRSYLKTQFLYLLIVETCVIFGAVYTSSLIRFYAGGLPLAGAVDGLWMSATIVAAITAITMLSTGLYVGHLREGLAGILIRVVISMFMASMVAGIVFYLFPDLSLWRGVLAITYIQG